MDNNNNPLVSNPSVNTPQNPVTPTMGPQNVPNMQAPTNPTMPAPQVAPMQPMAQPVVNQQSPAQPTIPTEIIRQNTTVAPAGEQPKKGKGAVIAIVLLLFLVVISFLVYAIVSSGSKSPAAKYTKGEPIYESQIAEIDEDVNLYENLYFDVPSFLSDVSTSDADIEYSAPSGSEEYSGCVMSLTAIKGFSDAKKYAALLAKDYEDSLTDEVREVKTNDITWYQVATTTPHSYLNMYQAVIDGHLYQFKYQVGENASKECKEHEQTTLNSIYSRK